MTKSLKLALVAAGQLQRYPVTRLRNLADHLGPVKAPSYRQASRFANSLKAGYPVHHYGDLDSSRVILVCALDGQLRTLVSELESADLNWEHKSVLLCAGNSDTGLLRGFASKGASVGSLFFLRVPQPNRFFVEGHRPAVRAAKALVEGAGGQALEVRLGQSAACAAGVTLATTLLISAMHSAAQCFRLAGISSRDTANTVGGLAEIAARSYLKAGARACPLPRSVEERYAFRERSESLKRTDPKLGAFFSDLSKLALKAHGRDSSWLEEPPLRVYHASSARS